jgi:hypothetical protein
MKKNILLFLGIIAFALIISLNLNIGLDNTTEIDVTLANVEALVLAECTGGTSPCSADCNGEYCGYCSGSGGYLSQCTYW